MRQHKLWAQSWALETATTEASKGKHALQQYKMFVLNAGKGYDCTTPIDRVMDEDKRWLSGQFWNHTRTASNNREK